jgi:ATP-dependent Clp protease ATP-binding subunit ClpB
MANEHPPKELAAMLMEKVVGQDASMNAIVPYVQMFRAGLSPEGRPVGVFLLLGPTGTGKTHTVEALAEALHGSRKNIVKIDCGEFQMEHEVAKLIGAPPGYLGHRETHPLLTQTKLNAATSENCNMSIVLFDEIEKAASSLNRLLLGVLDKATLRLGDNTTVNFERSLIFLTSNLGAREMARELVPDFGFEAMARTAARSDKALKLEKVSMAAVRRKFSPEFINRIDSIVTYQPLENSSLEAILDQQIHDFQSHIQTRLGPRGFFVEVAMESRQFLLRRGTSAAYGARELKRTIHKHLIQPVAAMVADGKIEAGARVQVLCMGEEKLTIAVRDTRLRTVTRENIYAD